MSLARFFSQAFFDCSLLTLVGLGRARLDLIWGTQPTPEEAGATVGLRSALLGFSRVEKEASRSTLVTKPDCFPSIKFKRAALRRLQTTIFQIARAFSQLVFRLAWNWWNRTDRERWQRDHLLSLPFL